MDGKLPERVMLRWMEGNLEWINDAVAVVVRSERATGRLQVSSSGFQTARFQAVAPAP